MTAGIHTGRGIDMEDLGTITDTAGVELTTGDLLPEPVALRSWRRATSWTEERTDRMKVLLGEGLSCSRIASDLGGGLTRNAVIGKISRMGLRTPGKRVPTVCKDPTTSAGRRRRKRTSAVPDARGTYFPSSKFSAAVDASEATDIREEFVPTNPIRFIDSTEQTCKWPLGEPSAAMLICGDPVRDQSGCPYCSYHSRGAYKPSSGPKPWVPGRVE